MKAELLNHIYCLSCSNTDFNLISDQFSHDEIRSGHLTCRKCSEKYIIKNGILNLLKYPSETVKQEMQVHVSRDKFKDDESFISSLKHLKNQYLKLPEGDSSVFFSENRYFSAIKDSASFFYEAIQIASLDHDSKILDCGADSCWSTAKLAEMGYNCTAIDINHHLVISDFYLQGKNIFFERVTADMGALPFRPLSFDAAFTISSIHHTRDLEKTVSGIYSALKKGGKLILVNEPVNPVFRSITDREFGGIDFEDGVNEHTYSITDYRRAARKAGFCFNLFLPKNTFPQEKKFHYRISNWLTFFNRIPVIRELIFIVINLIVSFPMIIVLKKDK